MAFFGNDEYISQLPEEPPAFEQEQQLNAGGNMLVSDELKKCFTDIFGKDWRHRKSPPPGEGERVTTEDIANTIGNHDYMYTDDAPSDAEKGVVFAGPTVQEVAKLFPELIIQGDDGNLRIDVARAALTNFGLTSQLARDIRDLKDLMKEIINELVVSQTSEYDIMPKAEGQWRRFR